MEYISTTHGTSVEQKEPTEEAHSNPHAACSAGAQRVGASMPARHVLRSPAWAQREPEQDGGVVGDQAVVFQQQNAPDRRDLPRAPRRSSVSSPSAGAAAEQQEVIGDASQLTRR